MQTDALSPELESSLAEVARELDRIPGDRKVLLRELADFVAGRSARGETARLIFICTHNSRRSHMAQIWAQTAADRCGVACVETFSGGTEATAFNPRAVAALQRAGFDIRTEVAGNNPIYAVRGHTGAEPQRAFSKVYDRPPNPREGFCAVMTCSHADEACPLVEGAAARVAIPYDDPKAADGSDREAEVYDERCRQIAREMLYLFSQVGSRSA